MGGGGVAAPNPPPNPSLPPPEKHLHGPKTKGWRGGGRRRGRRAWREGGGSGEQESWGGKRRKRGRGATASRRHTGALHPIPSSAANKNDRLGAGASLSDKPQAGRAPRRSIAGCTAGMRSAHRPRSSPTTLARHMELFGIDMRAERSACTSRHAACAAHGRDPRLQLLQRAAVVPPAMHQRTTLSSTGRARRGACRAAQGGHGLRLQWL